MDSNRRAAVAVLKESLERVNGRWLWPQDVRDGRATDADVKEVLRRGAERRGSVTVALNPIVFTDKVVKSFLRYQLTTYALADERLNRQMRELLSLDATRRSPWRAPRARRAHRLPAGAGVRSRPVGPRPCRADAQDQQEGAADG